MWISLTGKLFFWGIIDFWIFLEFYNIERGGSEIIVAFYSVKVLLFDWIELIGVKQCDQLTFQRLRRANILNGHK